MPGVIKTMSRHYLKLSPTLAQSFPLGFLKILISDSQKGVDPCLSDDLCEHGVTAQAGKLLGNTIQYYLSIPYVSHLLLNK